MRQRWIVGGRVQGVGFRWWATQQAGLLGLSGFCRNLADGSVEVEADGTPDQVAAMERLLAAGPRNAHVTSVDRQPPGSMSYDGFSIRR